MPQRLFELLTLFLKLGLIGFGGPATHIATIEEEVVTRRQWMTPQHYLDLVGATNLIPGPNSTEIAIYVGFVRAGYPGLVVAGVGFIFPAVVITTAFAMAYLRFGSIPNVAPFLDGIKPAVLAVIFAAMLRFGQKAVKSWRLALLGLLVALYSMLGLNEVIALLSGGFIGMIWLRASDGKSHNGEKTGAAVGSLALVSTLKSAKAWAGPLAVAVGGGIVGVPLWKLGLFFLKVGSVMYGTGYVLVAFLEGGLVHDYGWLTQKQLLDAIAIGQFTPGPLLSTATFIGYLLSGFPGAVIATIGIFLPSFLFVALLNPLVPRLRNSVWTSVFMDAVNVSAIALMATVTIKLGCATLTRWPAWIIAGAASVAAVRWKVNAPWLVLAGAILGWLFAWV
ncbi:MAG: chromate efflux transporter [Armatimonadetes bacterium]|nr:chromate efflux transporter [Armatimonadota bacterium]